MPACTKRMIFRQYLLDTVRINLQLFKLDTLTTAGVFSALFFVL